MEIEQYMHTVSAIVYLHAEGGDNGKTCTCLLSRLNPSRIPRPFDALALRPCGFRSLASAAVHASSGVHVDVDKWEGFYTETLHQRTRVHHFHCDLHLPKWVEWGPLSKYPDAYMVPVSLRDGAIMGNYKIIDARMRYLIAMSRTILSSPWNERPI